MPVFLITALFSRRSGAPDAVSMSPGALLSARSHSTLVGLAPAGQLSSAGLASCTILWCTAQSLFCRLSDVIHALGLGLIVLIRCPSRWPKRRTSRALTTLLLRRQRAQQKRWQRLSQRRSLLMQRPRRRVWRKWMRRCAGERGETLEDTVSYIHSEFWRLEHATPVVAGPCTGLCAAMLQARNRNTYRLLSILAS